MLISNKCDGNSYVLTLYQREAASHPEPCFLEVGPASMVVGHLVAGKRTAQASGRELAHLEESDQARKVLQCPGGRGPPSAC